MIAATVIGYLLIGVVVGLFTTLSNSRADADDVVLVGAQVFFAMLIWPLVLFVVGIGFIGVLISDRLRRNR